MILEVGDNDRKFLSRCSAKMSDNDLAKVKKSDNEQKT